MENNYDYQEEPLASEYEPMNAADMTAEDWQEYDREDMENSCSYCGNPNACDCGGCYDDDRIQEDMDGDAQSALASAGFGTDEDYGGYEDDDLGYHSGGFPGDY